jgi:high-affinity K+ transport system ATPase subunit B
MSLAVERSNPVFSVRRVGAMALRYLYLLRGSWPRVAELAYWPTMQMILWGFITQFFATHSSCCSAARSASRSASWRRCGRATSGICSSVR